MPTRNTIALGMRLLTGVGQGPAPAAPGRGKPCRTRVLQEASVFSSVPVPLYKTSHKSCRDIRRPRPSPPNGIYVRLDHPYDTAYTAPQKSAKSSLFLSLFPHAPHPQGPQGASWRGDFNCVAEDDDRLAPWPPATADMATPRDSPMSNASAFALVDV